jgi:hypothetical protein
LPFAELQRRIREDASDFVRELRELEVLPIRGKILRLRTLRVLRSG